MSICLATTWYPRGEYPRFMQFLPVLEQVYAGIVISLIPNDDQDVIQQFKSGRFSSNSKVSFHVIEDRKRGRYMAIKKALETPADFIHYADMDRLLHWVETRPEEWKQAVEDIKKFDCIIFGRTQAAFLTHPQALITTEIISNRIVSNILKVEMDVSAGSKSFSRSSAQYIIDNCRPDNSIGTDAEWPICLKQAGFRLEYIPVEGLEWESADQYLSHAANSDERAKAARDYDEDPRHWSRRIEIAYEIIQTAIEISRKRYPIPCENQLKPMDFDFTAVFDVDDYIYFYSEALTDERTDQEVSALASLLTLDHPMKILDLACGFGRHTNRLAKMGHKMTGVDITSGFLEIARQDAVQKGVNVHYQQDDMRYINFVNEFDCVMLLFTAFGYFSDEENLQVLVNIKDALIPGGLLIFDTNHRDTFLKNMRPFFVAEKEGNLMIDRISFDSLQGRLYNRRIVIRDGIRKDKPFFIRLYNPNEIQALIIRAGLVLDHIYGGWDAQELSQDSNRIIVVARKPDLI
jgi:SAM-dependent methyltransferase